MGGSVSREMQLANALQDLCDDEGVEINPTESANVLNEFGLLYKEKSPDKVSLVQSCAFLNACTVRQPASKKFKNDLEELCSHVLLVAKAKESKTNLCSIANETTVIIKEMRKHTEESLKKIQCIPLSLEENELKECQVKFTKQVRKLQVQISESYISLMNNIANASIRIMGSPPCRYCIAGMGSLAKQEITPFSDFEHVILLEEGVQNKPNYLDTLEYFRWASVIFHIIVINLKETILRSMAIPWLNDDSLIGGDWFYDAHTTCGIKFDGMQLTACKVPLGRTRTTDNKPFTLELIKPVSEMAKLLEKKEDIKNGYHLADVLTKTCFVSGSPKIFEDFQKCIYQKKVFLDGSSALNDMKQHYKEFNAIGYLRGMIRTRMCDVKRALYRTSTLFVSTLGKIHAINKPSSFEIIDLIYQKEQICIDTHHSLSYMIAISCFIRLKAYMHQKTQNDFFDNVLINSDNGKLYSRLSELVGEQIFGDYFVIATSLQQTMKVSFKRRICWKNIALNQSHKLSIFSALYLRRRVIFEWEDYTKHYAEKKWLKDSKVKCIVASTYCYFSDYDKALRLYLDESSSAQDAETIIAAIRGVIDCLHKLQRFEEGSQYIEISKRRVSAFQLSHDDRCHMLAYLAFECGHCKCGLNQLQEALNSYREALRFNSCMRVKRINSRSSEEMCYLSMGTCFNKLRRRKEAIVCTSITCILLMKDDLEREGVYTCYNNLWLLYFEVGEFRAAFKYFMAARKIKSETRKNESKIRMYEKLYKQASKREIIKIDVRSRLKLPSRVRRVCSFIYWCVMVGSNVSPWMFENF